MIQFLDIQAINKQHDKELKQAILQVYDSGWFILGDKLKAFEKEFATYCNVKHCLGVGTGLDALILILKGYMEMGLLEKGDRVLVPSNTFIASVLAISQCDLQPILVEPSTDYLMDVKDAIKKYSSKVKAIMPVHLYGQMVNMDEVKSFADENDLLIIEDAAQAHGSQWNGKKAGEIGGASAFSFYPGKNLGALGDGGAICTNDTELYEVLISLRNYGSKVKYDHQLKGTNSRLDEIQAAVLSVKLKYLNEQNELRRLIAQKYLDEINNEFIQLPMVQNLAKPVWHLFVIKTENRDSFIEYMGSNKIQVGVHYPKAIQNQECYKEDFSGYNGEKSSFDEQRIVSLPISPILNEAEVVKVIDACNSYRQGE